MRIDRFLGRSIEFDNGFSIGFNWVHANGTTSKTAAVLAAYHPRSSITWLWALYWHRPKTLPWRLWFQRTEYSGYVIQIPLLGSFSVSTQKKMPSGRV